MTIRLDDTIALVTGAAGGIGRAVCAALKDSGATVVATDLAELEELAGADVYWRHDVTSEADWGRIAAALGRDYGRLDALVNAAAIAPVQSIEETSLELWRKTQTVNVESILIGTRAMLPLLKTSGRMRKGGASIVNFSSVGGQRGAAFTAAYCTSKGAVKLFSKSAAAEFGALRYNIRVSSLGAVGLTAYFGLLETGRPEAGETVLVTGAAGAVGSVVGQIAGIKGCRTIGIAGGADKCRRLLEVYGFDVAIDYRGKSADALSAEIGRAAPGGVNIIFENVGGDILDAGLMNLAPRARIILCGLISEYNNPADHVGARWIAEGRLRIDEHVEAGLENEYPAFMKLFSGGNDGKLVLAIAP